MPAVSMERAIELYGSKVNFDNVPKTPCIDAWYERLKARPSFMRGCVIPETLHASMPVSEELPGWLRAYNRRYNIDTNATATAAAASVE